MFPKISIEVRLPDGTAPCPNCGLHYVQHGKVDERHCRRIQELDAYYERMDQN